MGTKENKYKYINKYKKENLKRIPFEVPIDKYNQIKEHTTKTGESVNGFLKRAVDSTMELDNMNGEK